MVPLHTFWLWATNVLVVQYVLLFVHITRMCGSKGRLCGALSRRWVLQRRRAGNGDPLPLSEAGDEILYRDGWGGVCIKLAAIVLN